jgi:hypothetical protein
MLLFNTGSLAIQLHFSGRASPRLGTTGRRSTTLPLPNNDFNFFLPFYLLSSPSAARFLMPIATSPSALPRPATFAKMEDRKRPASGAVDDCAPPSKRQAVNGSSKSKDDSGDMKEEAWIEVSVSHDTPCVVPPSSSSRKSCPQVGRRQPSADADSSLAATAGSKRE